MDPLLSHTAAILSLAGLNLIALISPGPDFAVIVRNSLIYSRKTAFLTALGIALGCLVHVAYSILGLGLIIKENEWLFQGVKYLGAGYLFYIGVKGLRAQKKAAHIKNEQHREDISAFAAVRSGFLTNALNPKCMLFFISLFSIAISDDTPASVMAAYGGIIFLETLIWFGFVAFCLSGKQTREKFNAVGHWIDRFTGGALIILGTKLFLTS